MQEINFEGEVFVSTKRAADLTGYTTDYVGQLARGGKVASRLVGRNWYLNKDAILRHKFGTYASSVDSPKVEATSSTNVSLPSADKVAPSSHTDVQASTPKEEAVAKDGQDNIVQNTSEDTAKILAEMQGAWSEWFAHKDEENKDDVLEHIHESSHLEESREENVALNKIQKPAQEAEVSEVESAPELVIPQEQALEEYEDRAVLPAVRSNFLGGVLAGAIVMVLIFGGLTLLQQGKVRNVANVLQSATDFITGTKSFERD